MGRKSGQLAARWAVGVAALAVLAILLGAPAAHAAAPVYSDAGHSGGWYGTTSTTSPGGGAYEDINMSTSAGQTVCASAWVRSDYPFTGASGTFAVWLIGESPSESGSEGYGSLGNLSKWTDLHACAEATTAHSQVRIQFYPAPGSPAVDMDDVDVHESLAVNGGFEEGGAGWTPYPNAGSNFSVYAGGASNPSHSGGHFGATNAAQGGGGIYDDVSLNTSPGQLVCGSAWVRTEGSATGASGSFALWLLGNTSNESSTARYSGLGNGTNWTQLHTCVEATGAHSTLRIQFYPTPGSPTVEIDDVDVHESLAVNGGFEEGGAGWTPYPNAGSNFSVYAGGASNPSHSGGHFGATNAAQGGGGIYDDVSLNTSPGQLVCGSAWVRTEGSATGASGSFALWLLGNTSNESSTARYSGLGNGTNWTQLHTCVEATGAHSTLRIQFYPTPGSPTVEIDDVDVHKSIVPNGGFEYGSGPWGTYPGTNSTYSTVRTHDVLGPVVTIPQPVALPKPKGKHVLKVRLSISWTYRYAITRWDKSSIGRFPGRTRLRVQCLGRGCSHKAMVATGRKPIKRLLHKLRGRRYRVGQRLRLTLSAPDWKPEKAQITFRYARLPRARLL